LSNVCAIRSVGRPVARASRAASSATIVWLPWAWNAATVPVHERFDQFRVSPDRLGARIAEGQEDREHRCRSSGLTGGLRLRVVDG
jgi:hypothetical protein